MTTQPTLTEGVRYGVEDPVTSGSRVTMGNLRNGVPIRFAQAGTGTTSDGNNWDAQAAIVLAISVSVTNRTGALDGGTATVQVNAAGQSAYGIADGWVQVGPTIAWIAGQTPLFLADVLGGAPILTVTGTGAARVRIVVNGLGTDDVEVTAHVAPALAAPTC